MSAVLRVSCRLSWPPTTHRCALFEIALQRLGYLTSYATGPVDDGSQAGWKAGVIIPTPLAPL